ncbi:unnamed protein product [Trichogramma brassicae]|uniref:Reverse transcriptase RNase H-like domain-containing protein n=1 Tax=Trichogramma brassicae TaxID=86971 RepID=A0A6H5IXT2_9HYME|nr:unnamed protein product [Trichogramma brassicae]
MGQLSMKKLENTSTALIPTTSTIINFLMMVGTTADILIQPINNNPGLYYEDYRSVVLKKATWRVAIYLNITVWTREHLLFQSYIQLERHCFSKTPTPSCCLFKNTDILQQFRVIQQLQEKIKLARQTAIPPNTLRNPLSVTRTRSLARPTQLTFTPFSVHPRENLLQIEGASERVALEAVTSGKSSRICSLQIGLSEVTELQREEIRQLVDRILPTREVPVGCTSWAEHRIIVDESQRPVKQRYYPVSKKLEEDMHSQVRELLAAGHIRRSSSEWSSPVVMVCKANGSYRLCIDYRKINAVTKGEEQQAAFERIKALIASAPMLSRPSFEHEFVVQTDASDSGLGAVLTQTIDGEEKVLCFASRTLNKVDRNYSVTERECLAVLWAIQKFRPYVEGYRFRVITDHSSLRWLHNLRNPTGKLSRWSLELQQFDYIVEHRKGTKTSCRMHCLVCTKTRATKSKLRPSQLTKKSKIAETRRLGRIEAEAALIAEEDEARIAWAMRMENLSGIRDKATENSQRAQERQAQYYNKKRRDVTFKLNDKVWRRNRILSSGAKGIAAKLGRRFRGPCKVSKLLGSNVYQLIGESGELLEKVTAIDLKPCYGRSSTAESDERNSTTANVTSGKSTTAAVSDERKSAVTDVTSGELLATSNTDDGKIATKTKVKILENPRVAARKKSIKRVNHKKRKKPSGQNLSPESTKALDDNESDDAMSTTPTRRMTRAQAKLKQAQEHHKCAATLYPLVESALPEETLRVWQRSVAQRDTADEEQNNTKDRLKRLISFLQNEVGGEERTELALNGFGIPDQESKKKITSPTGRNAERATDTYNIPSCSALINASEKKCVPSEPTGLSSRLHNERKQAAIKSSKEHSNEIQDDNLIELEPEKQDVKSDDSWVHDFERDIPICVTSSGRRIKRPQRLNL